MMRIVSLAVALLGLAVILSGCGGTSTPEKVYQIKTTSGLDRAKQILQNYVDGNPVGSEATSFPDIVEEVKKEDPQKAAILEQGFADIQRSPGNPAAKAKALMGKL